MKINKNYIVLSLLTTLSLAALSGCSTNRHDERSEGRVTDDKGITKAVKNNLKDEPVYKFTDVHVNTYAGIVQLTGFVDSQEQKTRAGEVAKQVPGVAKVENDLALKPQITYTNRQMSESGKAQSRIYSEPYNPDGVAEPTQGAPAKQNLKSTESNP